MKTAAIIMLLIVTFILINWFRTGGFENHIFQTIPFLGGKKPGLYDAAGLLCILIFLRGLGRLYGSGNSDDD